MQKLKMPELKELYPEIDLTLDDLKKLEVGRHPITDEVFVIVSAYETQRKADKSFEAHKDYLDVQVVLEGKETISVKPVSELKESVPYNKEKDVAFYLTDAGGVDCSMQEGDALLLFPEDGHMPGADFTDGEHGQVKKAVIKIPYKK